MLIFEDFFKFFSVFKNVIGELVDAIRNKNASKAIEWSKTVEWSTIEHFLVDGGAAIDGWDCPICTFYNEPTYTVCNMCNTPRPA